MHSSQKYSYHKMNIKLLFILCCISLISCEVSPVDTEDPDYVYDGRGGIKCKANGNELLPAVSFNGTGASMDLRFLPWGDQNILSIYFNDRGDSPDFISQAIEIRVNNVIPESVFVGDKYVLSSESNVGYGQYRINSADFNYTTNDANTGVLEILYHDLDKRILGGTFEYDAIDENGIVIAIREGEFDIKY